MKSVFRTIICLVLCVSLILGCFPRKAEAVVAEAAVAIGVAACLILMTAGVVFNPRTVEDVKAIGQSFQNYMYKWGSDNNKTKDVESFIESIVVVIPGGGNPKPYDLKLLQIAEFIKEAVYGWVYAVSINNLMINTNTGTGFIVSSADNHKTSVEWAKSLDIYSMANSAGAGSFLLLGGNNTSLDNVSMWYGASVQYNTVYGINMLRIVPVSNLKTYTNLNYPAGTFVNHGLSTTSEQFFDHFDYWTRRGNLNYCLNYDAALALYELHQNGSITIPEDNILFLQPDTKIYPRLVDSSSTWLNPIYVENYGYINLTNGTVSTKSDYPALANSSTSQSSYRSYGIIPLDIVLEPTIVGDMLQELEKGAMDKFPSDIYFGEILKDYFTPLQSLQQISQQMTQGEVTVEEYQETVSGGHGAADRPAFSMNIPLGSTLTYSVGDVPSPINIIATVNDGGTLTYEWRRFGQSDDGKMYGVEVLSTSSSFVPLTDEPGWSSYYCTVKNTDPDGFVSWNYSNSIRVNVVAAPAVDPDTGLDEEEQDMLADKIGVSVSGALMDALPDFQSSLQEAINSSNASEQDAATQTGQDGVNQIIDIIPDYSGDALPGLRKLASAMSYEGTRCVLKMPKIVVPAVGELFSEVELLEEQEVNFEEYFEKMPENLMTLIRAFFDVAVVFFCVREVKKLIGEALTGFHFSKSKEE